jgi:hypothetical protein
MSESEKVTKIKFKITKHGKDETHEIDSDLKGWAIVNEVGVGRWLGKIVEYSADARRAILCPALEMSSPSRAPVLTRHPTHGDIGGVITGFNCAFVLEQDSIHAIEDIYVSSIQRVDNMSDELRAYLFNILADSILGPIGADGKRRRNRQ